MSTYESQTGKLVPQSVLIKRYLIIRLAGRGGMSAIYLALDMQRNRQPVAIKEMSQENLDNTERAEAMVRFEQEIHLLGSLNHPNLPHIYDAFGAGGRSFLVMDFINGKTLLQLLREARQPLPVDQVLHYADQLCNVLIYLHQQRPPIIFRDLKPTNVMVTEEGHVYLIDFGIARFFKEGQRHDTVILGSPGYAPPEQHGIGQTNPRSDLYALGATLHCCLTNRDPYNGGDRFSFAPIRQFNPQVPPALDQLIMRLLSLDEEQRPTSALEVKQSLARIRQQIWEQQTSAHLPALPPMVGQNAYQATLPAEPQGKLVLRASSAMPAVQPPGPVSPYPAYPVYPAVRNPGEKPLALRTRVWTPAFTLNFFLLLIFTAGGSFLAMNIALFYPIHPGLNLTHIVEASLTFLLLMIALITAFITRSFLAVFILLLTIIATIGTLSAFLLQTLRDMQPITQFLLQITPAQVNLLLSYSLLTAGFVSLFWILRLPFHWGDRLWILLFFGSVCACAYLQSPYPDINLTKHLLLQGALILLIQGILVAGRMESRRRQR
jgi:serine/threonine protein kinase